MRRQGEPVRLLFLILAHDEPAHLARLAATLTAAAGDARVVVHFDAGARPDFLADHPDLLDTLILPEGGISVSSRSG